MVEGLCGGFSCHISCRVLPNIRVDIKDKGDLWGGIGVFPL